jgi:hypothetical protein
MSGVERQLRGMETRIAEDMTSILDFLSRIQQGLDEGNWHYARDKIYEFVRAVERLGVALEVELGERRTAARSRPKFVKAAITEFARHYRAGRALYPVGGDPVAAGVRAAIERAAAGLQYNPPEGLSRQDADRLATALRQHRPGGDT